jgi:hypothetical protein
MLFITFCGIYQRSRVEVQIMFFDERGNRSVLAHDCFLFEFRGEIKKIAEVRWFFYRSVQTYRYDETETDRIL